jgi:mono/diheme cytochrome c family protein
MRIYTVLSLLIVTVFVFSYCSSSKKAAAKKASTHLSYAGNIKTVVAGYCSPCHIPEKGGKKMAYDNYANVKEDIDEIIRRIELNPDERGYMPFKRDKLGDSTVAVFKQWKEQGLFEE